MPVKYSSEFKRDAVALVLTQGMSQKPSLLSGSANGNV